MNSFNVGNMYSLIYTTATKVIQNDYTSSIKGATVAPAMDPDNPGQSIITYVGAETISEIDQYVIDNQLIDPDMVVSLH